MAEEENEGQMTERIQAVMSAEDAEKLVLLTSANTGNNKSLLIRRLIRMAYQQPKRFGLHPPRLQSKDQQPTN